MDENLETHLLISYLANHLLLVKLKETQMGLSRAGFLSTGRMLDVQWLLLGLHG
jgi:hypothetical protein